MKPFLRNYKSIALCLFVLFTIAGCSSKSEKAEAILDSKSGSSVTGKVTFTKEGNVVKIIADIKGLSPGKHGFHIHEKGDCSAPDATSAGGHFNPRSMQHSGHQTTERHTGDMGNITADESGNAHLEISDSIMSFDGEESIIGKSVIVHEKEDDLKTQPTGDAGGRVACGVIVIVK